jgi:hypothetical protein
MDQECSICLDNITKKRKVLPCNHTFHRKCINKWFKNLHRCPLCLQFTRNKYKVTHINALSFLFFTKTIFFHNKHLVFGKKIIKYQHIINIKLFVNNMSFETIEKKLYIISTYKKSTTNEIFQQMKQNIEAKTKMRRNISQVSIV